MEGNRQALSTHLLLLGQLLRVAHQAAGVDQQEVAVAPEAARVQPAAVAAIRGLKPGKACKEAESRALHCLAGMAQRLARATDIRRGGGAL